MAEIEDTPAITDMRWQYTRRVGEPCLDPRAGAAWVVAERGGQVLAAIGVIDKGCMLNVCDFVRDERRPSSLSAMIALGRFACRWAVLDGKGVEVYVHRQNTRFEEGMLATGEWERISIGPTHTLYHFKRGGWTQ